MTSGGKHPGARGLAKQIGAMLGGIQFRGKWTVSHFVGGMLILILRSRGPGRWPGQSGKELGLTERLLHSLVEPQAAEVSRYCSGVLYNTDQKRGSKFRAQSSG